MTALLVALICQALTAAGGSWTGRVIDGRSHAPIAGAEVTIVGHRGVARTDASGRFRWTGSPPAAPATIVIILPDGHLTRPIRVAEWVPDSELVADSVFVETMTITGVAPTLDTPPGSSTTFLPGSDVEMRAPATLTQALENVPGVNTIADGGQGAVPAIRGLARGRSLIVVDGSRVSSERRAGANASFLDPAVIDTVEVGRGPGSVAYGSDAFGGVIAVRTRAPRYLAPLQVHASASAGAGIPQGRGQVEVSRGYGSDAVLVAVRAREFDDYASPSGVVPNSGWRDGGITARWDHDGDGRSWSIGWDTGLAREIGRARSDSAAIAATTPYEDSHRLTFSYEAGAAGWFRNVRVGGMLGSARDRIEQDRQPTPKQPRALTQSDTSSREGQVRVTGEHAFGRVRFQTGADLQGRYGLRADDTTVAYDLAGAVVSVQTNPSIASAHRTGIGVFGQADAQVMSRLRLAAGLRGDTVSNVNVEGYFGDRRVSNTAAAGLAAATMTLTSRSTFTAQIARGFRDPTLTDRFYRGPVGRGFIEGNPDLQPETSRQVDLTVRSDLGRFRLSGAYYDYHIANLVERYLVGTTNFYFRNRGAAHLQGTELEVQAEVSHGILLDLTAQLSRGRDADTKAPLDDIAPRSLSAVLRHSTGVRLDSYLRVTAVARHDAAGPTEVPTPGFVPVDAGTVWHWSPRLEMRASVRNLLDQRSYSNAGPRWVYSPGRNVLIALDVVF